MRKTSGEDEQFPRARVSLKRGAEPHSCPGEPRLHRSDRNSEHLRRFLVREPLDIDEHHDRSLLGRQCGQCCLQRSDQPVLLDLQRWLALAPLLRGSLERQVGMTASSTQVIERSVVSDPQDPGTEVGTPEAIQREVGTDECLLHDVLGCIAITEETDTHSENEALVALY